jgi:hypothetical protein
MNHPFTNIKKIYTMRFNFSFFLLIYILIYTTSCDFLSAGSYPYAEGYEINAVDSVLNRVILQFKEENPEFKVPKQLQLRDGPNDEMDHWSHIYFYYPEENEILYTWTRRISDSKTTFAFVSVNKGLTLGNWLKINHDFDSESNEL